MIVGERVRLRAVEHEDLQMFVRWLNDPEIRQFLEITIPMSQPQEEQWFSNMLKRPLEEQPLVIEVDLPKGWTPIGNTGFMSISLRDQSAEIGIFIGENRYHNQGYGTDAMNLMLWHGFQNLNLHRIFLHVYETNPRAQKCYEKVGFVPEGRLRQARYLNGEYVDVLLMGILKSEWKEKQRS